MPASVHGSRWRVGVRTAAYLSDTRFNRKCAVRCATIYTVGCGLSIGLSARFMPFALRAKPLAFVWCLNYGGTAISYGA
eukprot:3166061-Pleurochrysis_carterae.AAC.2